MQITSTGETLKAWLACALLLAAIAAGTVPESATDWLVKPGVVFSIEFTTKPV